MREARLEAGQSIEAVAQQLNLQPDLVEALEANDFSRFNALVFVRGHLRSYARLLNLDDESVLAALDQQRQPRAAVTSMPAAQRPLSKWRLPAALLAALLLWAAVVWLLQPRVHVDVNVQELPTLVDPLPLDAVTPLGAALLQRAGGEKPVAEAQQPVAARLTLSFSDDCWVQVKNYAGDVLLAGVQPKGQTVTLTALGPLDVVLAYWPAVALSYNGQPLELHKYTSHNATRLRLAES